MIRVAVAALVALGLGALAGLRPVAGLDIWWHLRTGERLLGSPGWLEVDTLSDGAAGQPWPYKDIGADILLYLAHSVGGDTVLSVVPALVGAGLTLLLARGSDRAAPPLAWAAVSACALAAMLHRLHARPMLASLLLFAALLGVLARARHATREAEARRGWALAVGLVLLGGWLHRGALLGAVLLVAAAAWSALAAPAEQRPRRTVQALLLVGLAAAALVANPNGLATVATATTLLAGDAYRSHVSEWNAMPLDALLRHHGVGLLPLLLALGLAIRARRRAEAVDVFAIMAAVALWVAALVSARWIAYAALASAWAALHAAPWPALQRPGRARLGAAFTLVVLLLAWERPASPLRPDAGWVGLWPDRFPVAALDYARRAKLPRRVENAYDFGGYLLWAGADWPGGPLLPSVDGRADMVYAPDVFDRSLRAEHEPRAFAEQQRVAARSWVLARQEPGGRTHAFLARDPAWALVFWSDPAAVFVRVADHPALAGRDALQLFRGVALDAEAFALGSDPTRREAAGRELARLRAMAPDSVAVQVAEVVFFHASGAKAARDAALEALVRRHGEHPAVRALLQRLSQAS